MGEDEDEAVTWLRQQVEGDKTAALAATPGPWEFEGDDPADDELYSVHDGEHGDLTGQTVAWTRHRQVANGQHMALHDPPGVVAGCEAKLAILDEHRPAGWVHEMPPPGEPEPDPWQRCAAGDGACPCGTLRHVASGYRHRPGYAEHWERPGIADLPV